MKLFGFLNLRTKPAVIDAPRRAMGRSGGTFVDSGTCMEVSAFYRAVIYISTQLAKLPWEIKDKDNKVLIDDRTAKLLRIKPNPEMNSFQFRLMLIQSALIKGNGYAEIERDPIGRPVALWPIEASRVEPIRSDSGTLFYRVNGLGDSTTVVYLPARDMFHIRNLHTYDGIVGQSIVGYAINTLGIALGADRFANGLFANGGRPSGILTHPGRMNDDSYKRLKESWDEQNGGRKTGGTTLLEEGVKYEAVSMDPQVMQFLESRKFSVIEVARFFGLPPSKLMDTTSATYSNVENANLEVATDTLDAWAVNIEMEADDKLLNEGFAGKFTELDLYALFRGDMVTRADYFNKMFNVSAISPNEIRMREGMSPVTGGDRYYIAANNFTPVDRLDEVIDSQASQSDKGSKAALPDPDDNAAAALLKPEESELDKAVITFLREGK